MPVPLIFERERSSGETGSACANFVRGFVKQVVKVEVPQVAEQCVSFTTPPPFSIISCVRYFFFLKKKA